MSFITTIQLPIQLASHKLVTRCAKMRVVWQPPALHSISVSPWVVLARTDIAPQDDQKDSHNYTVLEAQKKHVNF